MGHSFLENLFISLRPRHWIKNLFVFAALIFAEKFAEWQAWKDSLLAFGVFCLAASGVYLLNDAIDYSKDLEHPLKKDRPVAAGKISRPVALAAGVLLLAGSLSVFWVNKNLFFAAAAYIVLNILYSFWLKKMIIIDIISISFGFVLRVAAGAFAIGVAFSPWLLLCTFFLTLFLAIGKRKNELVALAGISASREVLSLYSVSLLDQMNMVVLPSALITYTLYTFNSGHSDWLIVTVPLVLYGLFRYLFIVNGKKESDNGPIDDLLMDRPLQIDIAVWILAVILILIYA